MLNVRHVLARAVRGTVESLEQRCMLSTVVSRNFSYQNTSQYIDVALADDVAEPFITGNAFKLLHLSQETSTDPTVDPVTTVSLNAEALNGGTDDGSTAHFIPIDSNGDFQSLGAGWYQTYVEGDSPTYTVENETFSFLPGDLDEDGGVSINDFNLLAGNYGKSGAVSNVTHLGPASEIIYLSGDLDYDGGVSINDFNALAGNYGKVLPALPTQAGNVVVANTVANCLDVGWLASGPATDRDGFKIYRSADGVNFSQVVTVQDPDAQTWRDEGTAGGPLVVGQRYWYRVRPYTELNGAGASLVKASGILTDRILPPILLAATPAGAGALKVSWTPSEDNSDDEVAGYKIYRSPSAVFSPSAATLVGSVNADTIQYTDTDTVLAAGGPYYYTVVAIGTRGGISAPALPYVSGTATPTVAPSLHISGPTSVSAGNVATFTAYGTCTTAVEWSVKLHNTELFTPRPTGVNFTFTPTVSGKYTITAVGKDAGNSEATDTLRLSVVKLAPTSQIKGPAVGVQGHALVFNAVVNGSRAPRDTTTYQWSLLHSDGSSVDLPSTAQLGDSEDVIVPGMLAPGGYQVLLKTSTEGIASEQTFAFDVISDPYAGRVQVGMLPTMGHDVAYLASESSTTALIDASVLQGDGKIIVAGRSYAYASDGRLFIARFNPDLTLDNTFGPNGSGLIAEDINPSTIGHSNSGRHIWAMMIHPTTGDLITVGDANPADNKPRALQVAAYLTSPSVIDGTMLPAGAPDPLFQPLLMANTRTMSTGFAIAMTKDGSGSFYIGGSAAVVDPNSDNTPPNKWVVRDLLVKVKSNGDLDGEFGPQGDGIAEQPPYTAVTVHPPFSNENSATSDEFSSWDYYALSHGGVRALVVLADGDVLTGGFTPWSARLDTATIGETEPLSEVVLKERLQSQIVKYDGSGTAPGTLDLAFGTNGVTQLTSDSVPPPSTPTGATEVAISSMQVVGNKITVAGVYGDVRRNTDDIRTRYCVFTARFIAEGQGEGQPDLTYGNAADHGVILRSELPLRLSNRNYIDTFFKFGPTRAAVVFEDSGILDVALNIDPPDEQAEFYRPAIWRVARIGSDGALLSKEKVEYTSPDEADAKEKNWQSSPTEDSSAVIWTPDGLVMGGAVNMDTAYPLLMRYQFPNLNSSGRPAEPRVGDVRVSVDTSAACRITWDNKGYGQDGFVIERRGQTGDAEWESVGTVGSTQHDLVDRFTDADTTYTYRVTPFHFDTESGSIVRASPSEGYIHTFPKSQSGYVLQEVVSVPANTTGAITQSVLTDDQTYLLVASGAFHIDGVNGDYLADADGWLSTAAADAHGHEFSGTPFGMALADYDENDPEAPSAVPPWSNTETATHQYMTAWVGAGRKLALRYRSAWETSPSAPENLGEESIQVAIYARTPQGVPMSQVPAPFDQPVLRIDLPGAEVEGVNPVLSRNTPVRVLASSPDGTPTPWKLWIIDDNDVRTVIASGVGSAGALPAESEEVATFIPAMYRNGEYHLELSTNFASPAGNMTVKRSITVWSAMKAGALSYTATDGSFTAPSGRIGLFRSYDSGDVGRESDLPNFGPGWSLDLLDSHMTTTIRADTYDPSQTDGTMRAGDTVRFKVGGAWHTFEFAPVAVTQGARSTTGVQAILYQPRFIALDGSGATLEPPTPQKMDGDLVDLRHHLVYDEASNSLVSVDAAVAYAYAYYYPFPHKDNTSVINLAYNPAREAFQIWGTEDGHQGWNDYLLTEADGSSYRIDPESGQILETTDATGNATT